MLLAHRRNARLVMVSGSFNLVATGDDLYGYVAPALIPATWGQLNAATISAPSVFGYTVDEFGWYADGGGLLITLNSAPKTAFQWLQIKGPTLALTQLVVGDGTLIASTGGRFVTGTFHQFVIGDTYEILFG